MKNMWMIRAGKYSSLIDEFVNREIVAVDYGIGDITLKSEEDIRQLIEDIHPKRTKLSRSYIVSQVIKFRYEIKLGDYVITGDFPNKKYLFGSIVSDYYYNAELSDSGHCKNVYNVKWVCEIPQDKLQKSTRKDLGSVSQNVYMIKTKTKENILKVFKKIDEVKYEKLFETKTEGFTSNLKRNIIYFGAPGTGKSYNLNKDKDDLIEDKNYYERVTFHPDYSYANFIGTYKPVPKGDSISYEYVPGPFIRSLVKALKNPQKPFLLIIEEINRSNVAAVFGDVFQLLDRDKNNESRYSIETTEDMRKYLKEELGEVFEKIKIPSNMFIWATMNSADQGVFPMDTAFKRRWDFKYFGINYNEELIEHIKIYINDQEISWNDLRKAINNELLSYRINEDKLIGPFFAFNEYIDEERDDKEFKEIFKNKLIMYLFEDAAKGRRNDLFAGAKENNNIIYSRVCELFDEIGIEIFCDNIKDQLLNHDTE